MKEHDWNELYRHLLGQLRERGFLEVAEEVELAATQRIAPQDHGPMGRRLTGGRSAHEQRLLLPDLDSVDSQVPSRSPSGYEAFRASFTVLQTRLTEVPALIEAAYRDLEIGNALIEWWPDVPEGGVAAEFERFSAPDLTLGQDEQRQIKEALDHLTQLVERART